MTFDIPHMIATAVVIGLVVFGLGRLPATATMSRGRKALLTFAVIFVALLILNALWPAGAGG